MSIVPATPGASPPGPGPAPAPGGAGGAVQCPFTVLVDTREQRPYAFASLRTDAAQGRRPLAVSVVRGALSAGDYSIAGCSPGPDGRSWAAQIAVERKSLKDLLSTLSQARDRFERELNRLNELGFAAVVVEADWLSIFGWVPKCLDLLPDRLRLHERLHGDNVRHLRIPDIIRLLGFFQAKPKSQLAPLSIFRSVIAWEERFPKVHWWFCFGRTFAEHVTFRMLERWHKDHAKANRPPTA